MSGDGSLKRCSKCGVPAKIGRLMVWGKGGTMNTRAEPHIRMAIFHADVHRSTVHEIENTLGKPDKDLMYMAEKNVSRRFFSGLPDRIHDYEALSKTKKFKRKLMEEIREYSEIMGYGFVDIVDLEPGGGGTIRIKNPFNLDLVAAAVTGVFEFIEGKNFKCEWKREEDGSYLINIRVVENAPPPAERLPVETIPVLPGEGNLILCTGCGAPSILGENFDWDEKEGIIKEKRTGRRYIILSTYSLGMVFNELSREYGESVYDILVKAQRDWMYNHIEAIGLSMDAPHDSEGFQTFFMDYLGVFPVFGYGNPISFDSEGDIIRITVEDPCNIHMMAGILQGLYESLSQVPGTVGWEEQGDGVLEYTVAPAVGP
ncbi:MAG: hypothetical protein JW738_05060 [Actinobacteria bacterium]|nr:hypothetical protein [Actinomycetota bacterium]